MFNLENQKYINLLDLNAQIYTETEFNCKHIHLDSNSEEKVFMVAFRTIPEDSTGVAHILEHTALCGSKKYPVRDPFFMMIRRSLNTFMNAFTSSDWTAYPFATLNKKDFDNLLSVYIDASFFPNLDNLDFLQEGHRLSFDQDNISSEIQVKGVVFNEMKGAMSSITSQLWHGLSKHLYPSSTYKYNSGGNPEDIIDLTHEYLVDFHKKHYHPSNATFFTFGNLDPKEVQEYIKENVLDNFEPSKETLSVKNEKKINSPITVSDFYNPLPDDEDNHHVVLSWLLGESHDPIELLECILISNILLDNSASPLRKTLENTDLGKSLSPLTGLETSHKELVFAAGLEGVAANKQQEVENLIMDCLDKLIKNGISKDLIDSSIHQLEIRQREISGSGMPYGLQIMLTCLPSCIHNDNPLNVLDLDSSFKIIKNNLNQSGYIEKLIQEKIINNMHRINYSLIPDTDFNHKQQQEIKNKINDKTNKLSDQEKNQIIKINKELKKRQEKIDDIDILPKVSKKDIPSKRIYAEPLVQINQNQKNYYYKTGTNGITYHSMIFPSQPLTDEEFKVASLFANTLTDVGIGKASYEKIQKLQASITGGISANFMLIKDVNDDQHKLALKISSKSLEKNETKMQDLIFQTVSDANFTNKNRIKDMLNFISSSNEKSLIQNGHTYAMSNAAGQINKTAATSDMVSGLNCLNNVNKYSKQIDKHNNIKKYINLLESIKSKISNVPQYIFTASSRQIEKSMIQISDYDEIKIFDYQPKFHPQQESIGWITGAQVCYCAEAYPTVDIMHEDAPALTVLGGVLRNGYLHSAIREKGGAYGAGAIQDSKNQVFKFFSYRDPRCLETFADFNKSIEWSIDNISSENLEEGVLGVISNIDKPLSPYGEAFSDFSNCIENREQEIRLLFRSKVKDCSINDLKNVAKKYLIEGSNNSKKSVISGKNYTQEMKKLGFVIKNI